VSKYKRWERKTVGRICGAKDTEGIEEREKGLIRIIFFDKSIIL